MFDYDTIFAFCDNLSRIKSEGQMCLTKFPTIDQNQWQLADKLAIIHLALVWLLELLFLADCESPRVS